MTDARSFPSRSLKVTFVPRAVKAVNELVETTGCDESVAVNRAVQLYAFLAPKLAEGMELCLCDKDGTIHTVNMTDATD